ncbi:zinc dependent phospholipase C family protein [archaeon]|nr:zinc dependent phospholipase C family protein [archaeon]
MRSFFKKVISSTIAISAFLQPVLAWENGGRTKNIKDPKYGLHDWIAEEAVKMLPENEKEWINQNMPAFLLGTEAPDNQVIARKFLGKQLSRSYGDTFWHHNYYDENSNLIDDSASYRAEQEYDKALEALVNGNIELACFYAGAMSHYVSDLAVWAHVIGEYSIHGSEEPSAHSEFEKSVEKTLQAKKFSDPNHTSSIFQEFVRFDGSLDLITAYDSATKVGLRTHLGEIYSCTQMEKLLPMGPYNNGSYVDCKDWSEEYIIETGISINYSINAVADLLHSLYLQSQQTALNQETPTR